MAHAEPRATDPVVGRPVARPWRMRIRPRPGVAVLTGLVLGTVIVQTAVPVDAAQRRRARPTTTRARVIPLPPTTAAPTTAAPSTAAPTSAPTTTSPTTTAPAEPFRLTRPVIAVTVARGAAVTVTELVTYLPGFSGDLRWETPPERDGVVVTVVPNPGRNFADITARASNGAPLGSVPVPLVVRGGGIARDLVVVVTVTDGSSSGAVPGLRADQQWAATLDPVGTIPAGSSAAVTLRITRGNGFTGRLAASVPAAPAGITLGISENPVGDAATLVVAVAAGTAPGAYQVTLGLSSGSLSSTIVFGVVVP